MAATGHFYCFLVACPQAVDKNTKNLRTFETYHFFVVVAPYLIEMTKKNRTKEVNVNDNTLEKEGRAPEDELCDLIFRRGDCVMAGDGTITKPENTVGGNLIRRSHERTDVEETDPDATSCKQPDTRHANELLVLDQSAQKTGSRKDMKEALKDKGAQ